MSSKSFLYVLMVLAAIMIFLTYSPADTTYFWTYWCAVFVCLAFGYMMNTLFCADMSFVFDPNYDNWTRKVDPQS